MRFGDSLYLAGINDCDFIYHTHNNNMIIPFFRDSRIFIILHGARVSAKVVTVHYRTSPLVQGGIAYYFRYTPFLQFDLNFQAPLNERRCSI